LRVRARGAVAPIAEESRCCHFAQVLAVFVASVCCVLRYAVPSGWHRTGGQFAVMYATPMLGPYVLLNNVLGGQTPAMNAFLTSAGVSVVAAAILVRITSTLFESERIIFGR